MTQVRRDKLAGFYGSWGSGLATITTQSGEQVFCDSGCAGRALGDAFGAIADNQTIDSSKIAGKEVVLILDEMGFVLAGFVKIEDWNGDELPFGQWVTVDDQGKLDREELEVCAGNDPDIYPHFHK